MIKVENCPTALPNDSSSSPSPLSIVEQQSLAIDNSTKDGLVSSFHVVVKNTPFLVRYRLHDHFSINGRLIDFHQLSLEASLVYDASDGVGDEMPVPFFKQAPVTYKAKVNGSAVVLDAEYKIRVLSSHNENRHFRIKLSCSDPSTGMVYPSLCSLTEPIKVVSKPDGVRSNKRRRGGASASSSGSSGSSTKKRSVTNQALLDAIQAMDRENERRHEQMMKALDRHHAGTDVEDGPEKPATSPMMMVDDPAAAIKCSDSLDLARAYQAFVLAFRSVQHDKRAEAVRGVLKGSTASDIETFSEALGMFECEGANVRPFSEYNMPAAPSMGDDESPIQVEGADCVKLLSAPHAFTTSYSHSAFGWDVEPYGL